MDHIYKDIKEHNPIKKQKKNDRIGWYGCWYA